MHAVRHESSGALPRFKYKGQGSHGRNDRIPTYGTASLLGSFPLGSSFAGAESAAEWARASVGSRFPGNRQVVLFHLPLTCHLGHTWGISLCFGFSLECSLPTAVGLGVKVLDCFSHFWSSQTSVFTRLGDGCCPVIFRHCWASPLELRASLDHLLTIPVIPTPTPTSPSNLPFFPNAYPVPPASWLSSQPVT